MSERVLEFSAKRCVLLAAYVRRHRGVGNRVGGEEYPCGSVWTPTTKKGRREKRDNIAAVHLRGAEREVRERFLMN